MASQSLEIPSFVLGALVASGGILGYVRTQSVPSIVAGCSVGALYGLGGYRIQNGEPFGTELSLFASIVLAGSSVPRALRGKKPIPVLLSLLSSYGLFVFGNATVKNLNL